MSYDGAGAVKSRKRMVYRSVKTLYSFYPNKPIKKGIVDVNIPEDVYREMRSPFGKTLFVDVKIPGEPLGEHEICAAVTKYAIKHEYGNEVLYLTPIIIFDNK